MNERGFFTIVGLCLLLVVAISIRGVQEFEGNYSIGATNDLIELELQNYAEDGATRHAIGTQFIPSEKLGTVTVEVKLYRNTTYIRQYRRSYLSGSETKDSAVKKADGDDAAEYAKIYTSVASCENPYVGGKISRRVIAYVREDETVCFMNTP